MRGGRQHELVPFAGEPEVHATPWDPNRTYTTESKWQCQKCGEKYQVRTTAPSCTIDFITQVELVAAAHPTLTDPQLEYAIDGLVKQRLHWPKFQRERIIRDWQRWRQFVLAKATPRYQLQFTTGEWFVGATDLHKTTWTVDATQATSYGSRAEAQQIADAMARTQGLRLNVQERPA